MTGEQPDEFDLGPVCDFRLLCQEMLRATIPNKRLKEAKAASVDQTAFQTFFRSRDFRTQHQVDKAVKQALARTGKIPGDVQLGPDGKLIRCDDPDARAGHRSASAATYNKARGFLGYQVTFAVLTRLTPALDDSTKAEHAVPGYIVGLSVDPASSHPAIAARRAVEDARAIAPGLKEVLTDKGISQHGRPSCGPCTNSDSKSSET